jgi:hypothetical protein
VRILLYLWEDLKQDATMMKLVEECSGVGDLSAAGDVIRRVNYRISRYQGMHDVSGVPIPGLHRIEGSVETGESFDFGPFVGAALVLRLEDGRALGITLAGSDGRVLAEGHGPSRCLCC